MIAFVQKWIIWILGGYGILLTIGFGVQTYRLKGMELDRAIEETESYIRLSKQLSEVRKKDEQSQKDLQAISARYEELKNERANKSTLFADLASNNIRLSSVWRCPPSERTIVQTNVPVASKSSEEERLRWQSAERIDRAVYECQEQLNAVIDAYQIEYTHINGD